MDVIMNPALAFLRTVNWQGPEVFLVIAFVWLLVSGRWGILLVGIATIAMGHVAHDYIVMNIRTAETLIGIPLMVYCIGGALAAIMGTISFVKYMIA
jgi:hypothetical protein